jgi:ATP synthase subunit 6
MVVLTLFVSTLILFWVINSFTVNYFLVPSRVSLVVSSLKSTVDIFPVARGLSFLCVALLSSLIFVNFSGNVPGLSIPSLYYYFTCSVSVALWLSLMVVIFKTQARDFLAHILPFGSPSGLILFLPLVEIFSQIIRPFTLMVRLSTNLSSGHIIIYMFSFFSISSFTLTFILFFVLSALFLLELFISLLQAYIFTSLIYLYIAEGLPQDA